MAVGDAAGLVDPITGEGLYYAIRSADLAARSLLSEVGELAERATQYRRCCGGISWPTWSSARAWPSVYFWAASCLARCRRAWCSLRDAARDSLPVMQDLFAGHQPYLGLKRRLLKI